MNNQDKPIALEDAGVTFPFEIIPWDHPEDMQKPWIRDTLFVPIVLVYSLCLIFGSTGNAVVMWAMCSTRNQTVTGMFLVSLAVADLLLLLSAPADVASYFVRCLKGGNVTCKMVGYGRMLSAFATVLNLMAISIERYIVIVFPMRSRQLCTIRNGKLTLMIVWTLAVLMALPSIFTWEVEPFFYGKFNNDSKAIPETVVTVFFCEEATIEDGQIMSIYHLVLLFVLPLVLHSFCYSKMIYVLWSSTSGANYLATYGDCDGNGPADITTMNNNQQLFVSQRNIVENPLASSTGTHECKSDRRRLLQIPKFKLATHTNKKTEGTGLKLVRQGLCRNRAQSLAYAECPRRVILHRKKFNQQFAADGSHEQDRDPHLVTAVMRQGAALKSGRRQVIKMLLAITLTFMVCWGPMMIFEVVRFYGLTYYGTMTYLAKILVKLLPYAQCCLNPIIYGFLSKNFRKSLRKACICLVHKHVTDDSSAPKQISLFSNAFSAMQPSPKLEHRRKSCVNV